MNEREGDGAGWSEALRRRIERAGRVLMRVTRRRNLAHEQLRDETRALLVSVADEGRRQELLCWCLHHEIPTVQALALESPDTPREALAAWGETIPESQVMRVAVLAGEQHPQLLAQVLARHPGELAQVLDWGAGHPDGIWGPIEQRLDLSGWPGRPDAAISKVMRSVRWWPLFGARLMERVRWAPARDRRVQDELCQALSTMPVTPLDVAVRVIALLPGAGVGHQTALGEIARLVKIWGPVAGWPARVRADLLRHPDRAVRLEVARQIGGESPSIGPPAATQGAPRRR